MSTSLSYILIKANVFLSSLISICQVNKEIEFEIYEAIRYLKKFSPSISLET